MKQPRGLRYFVVLYFLFLSLQCFGQADSLRRADTHHTRRPDTALLKASLKPKKDSALTASGDTSRLRQTDSVGGIAGAGDSLKIDSLTKDSLARVAAARQKLQALKPPKPQGMEGVPRAITGKEDLFYVLAAIFILLGIIKVAYPKYFQNTFRFVFQTSLRQKQTPEQIVQGYVPGFLLNVLFFLVGGVAITLYCRHTLTYSFLTKPLWLIVLASSFVLAVVYMVKYLVTLFAGWVFNAKQAAGMYSFIVFLINRFIGVLLLPIVVLSAFYNGETQVVMFTIMGGVIVFLMLYRYLLSLTVVRKNLKISALHFFIYLCAVELMPLLVIYKVLFSEIPSSK